MLILKKIFLMIWELFFSFPEKIRFILVGGWNVVFGYITFYVFWNVFGHFFGYTGALMGQFTIASVHTFLTMKIFVFRTKSRWISEYSRTLISVFIIFCMNWFLLFILVETLHMQVLTSQGIATIIMGLINYFLHKYFSFGFQKKDNKNA